MQNYTVRELVQVREHYAALRTERRKQLFTWTAIHHGHAEAGKTKPIWMASISVPPKLQLVMCCQALANTIGGGN